jgi:hypothetical protein
MMLFDEKKSKDPVSTRSELMISGNFLHDVDKNFQIIIDFIIEQQNILVQVNGGNDKIVAQLQLPNIKANIELKRVVPIGELKKIK